MTSINLLSVHSLNHQQDDFVHFLHENKLISLMLVISVILHVMLFLRFGDIDQHNSENSLSRNLVISLTSITPEAPPEITQKPQQKPDPESTRSRPELVKKTDRHADKLITEQQLKQNTQQKVPQTQQRTAQQQSEVAIQDPALLNRSKDDYMKILAAHIDKHKFYPRSARRRQIEGKVQVSFDLLTNGQILNLHTFSGPSILQQATMDSIRSALPMPNRPESLLALNTMKIEYSMLFVLK